MKKLFAFSLLFSFTVTPAVEAATLNELKESLQQLQQVLNQQSVPQGQVLGVSTNSDGYTVFTESADTLKIYVSSSEGDDANDGLSEATPKATIAAGKELMRYGYPDWLLLKKGDVWFEGLNFVSSNIQEDAIAGRSASEMALISSYGTGARPELRLDGGDDGRDRFLRTHNHDYYPEFLAIVGLEFNAYLRDPEHANFDPLASASFMTLSALDTFLIEDNLFKYVGIALQDQYTDDGKDAENVTLRRNIFMYNYSTNSHAQGIYTYNIKNLTLEENVFNRNGWHPDVPGAKSTIFNRNAYLSSADGNTTYSGNIDADGASGGVQNRTGGTIEDNLFLNNPHAIVLGHSENPRNQNVPGLIRNNVVLGTRDIDTQAQGTGIVLQSTENITRSHGGYSYLEDVEVYDNIIANATEGTGNVGGFKLFGDGRYINVNVYDNIVYNWAKPWSSDSDHRANGVWVGEISSDSVNSGFYNNIIQQPNGGYVMNSPAQSAAGFEIRDNTYWSSEDIDSLWWSKGWFDQWGIGTVDAQEWVDATGDTNSTLGQVYFHEPTRTIDSYMDHIGIGGGYDEFMRRASLQSKDTYDDRFTAYEVNEYIRKGFEIVGEGETIEAPEPVEIEEIVEEDTVEEEETPGASPESDTEQEEDAVTSESEESTDTQSDSSSDTSSNSNTDTEDEEEEENDEEEEDDQEEEKVENEVEEERMSTTPTKKRLRTISNLNVRVTPGGSLIRMVSLGSGGTEIEGTETTKNGLTWIKVNFDNGTTGYVAKTYTAADSSASSVANNRVRTTDNLNVRTTPGGKLIKKVLLGTKGTKLTDTLTEQGGYQWLKVQFDDGTTGYVASGFLASDTSSSLSATERAEKIADLRAQLAVLVALLEAMQTDR